MTKDDTLKNAIESESSATITSFLNSLPSQICAKIDLKSVDQVTIQNTSKTGCTSSEERVVARRTFIANDFTVYYAEIESWYTG